MDGQWRVGRHYKVHVYAGDMPVATFFQEEDARRAVADRAEVERLRDALEIAAVRFESIARMKNAGLIKDCAEAAGKLVRDALRQGGAVRPRPSIEGGSWPALTNAADD